MTGVQTCALPISERRVRKIMDHVPVTITYIDADYRYRYINRAQEMWLGKTFDEVAGRKVREVVGETVWADVEPKLKAVLAGEVVHIERQRVDRSGNSVWHSGRHVPDVNEDGNIVGDLFGILRYHAAQTGRESVAGQQRNARREGSGGGGEPSQVAIPRGYEPRDPHTDERRARHG